MKKITLMAIAAIGFAATVQAQSTSSNATVEVHAKIVAPIEITPQANMDFGDLAVTTGGTVTIGWDNVVAPPVGGVSLVPATTNPRNRAEFALQGEPDYAYNYTTPVTAGGVFVLTGPAGSSPIPVSLITSENSATGVRTLDNSGLDQLYFGATITLAANQMAGLYQNLTSFNVIVNYN